MTSYRCGCQPPTYCPTHADWACHDPHDMCPNCVTPWKCNGPHIFQDCPACRNTRWRSVTLDARATPTRRGSK